MAPAIPAILAVSAIVGAGTQLYSAKKQQDAADKAEKIGEENAEMARAETEEEARRLEIAQAEQMSTGKARAYASGLDPTVGSTDQFFKTMTTRQSEELDWLKKTGARRADMLEEQGEFASSAARQAAFGSVGNAFSFAPDIYGAGQKAKWWG